MAGAVLPLELSPSRTCYRVWWPEGDDWYSLLIGAVSRMYRRDYWATDDEDDLLELSESVLDALAATLGDGGCEMRAVGEIVAYAGAEPPSGWMLCDGTALAPSAYPDLFAVIGFSYGSVGGAEAFRLPDLQGRVPVGVQAGDADFNSRGDVGGAKSHTLTVEEMPQHNHPWNSRSGVAEAATFTTASPGASNRLVNGAAGGSEITQNPFIRNAGGGQAHSSVQPYQVVNYIIYVGS